MNDEQTHFGFTQVKASEKADKVADVFHSVAAKYDLMNDLMSFGLHRVWKQFTLEHTGLRSGHRALDLAGGTGDIGKKLAKRVGPQGEVVLADINDSMMRVGRERLVEQGVVGNIHYVQADAELLPFPDDYFHCVTIGFGLRNVTDKEKALRDMFRVLKPGGRLLVLEFSKPIVPLMSQLYDQYSFHVLPHMGKLVAGDAESYQYLAESIRMHPDQQALKTLIETAGFERVSYFNLTAGVVALHKAFKL